MIERHVEQIHTKPVVLDIGAGTGGLIIYTAAELRGAEIEVSPKGHDSRRVHADVAERRVNGRAVYAAVYLPLPAGDYTIWGPDPRRPSAVVIADGRVTEVDWRT